jgi:hypothetical protein
MDGRRARRMATVCGLVVVLAGALGPAPAAAAPIDKGHFHDVFTEPVDFCPGVHAERAVDVSGSFVFVKRGPGLAYYSESVHGTQVFTNLDTGGTLTEIFNVHSKDLKVTDNHDGTLTILVLATGSDRYYDSHGRFVLNDPGQIRFTILVDDNGTPGDPFDDEEIEGSFQLVKGSTGRNDTQGRDFCADLVTFTT